jgi:hypothetical protein
MEVIAFVGSSGTGKSHHALDIALQYNVDAIIDDGLLIHQGKIIAGFSAKREAHTIRAVRRAIFTDEKHVNEVREGLRRIGPKKVMLIGTSDRMVALIADALAIAQPSQTIYIEDVSSEANIAMARDLRMGHGKHVVPVPAIEMKRRFSGYVIESLENFFSGIAGHKEDEVQERTIVRPRFSYMGKLLIAENVFRTIAMYLAKRHPGCVKVSSCSVKNDEDGVMYHLGLVVSYGIKIPEMAVNLSEEISEEVLRLTGNPVLQTEITVRGIKLEGQG